MRLVRLGPPSLEKPRLTVQFFCRGTHKENPLQGRQRQDSDQVQGPLLTVPLHTIGGRPRKGREAQAEPAPWCVWIFGGNRRRSTDFTPRFDRHRGRQAQEEVILPHLRIRIS